MRMQGRTKGKPLGELDNGDLSWDHRRWGAPASEDAPEASVHKRAKQARACQTCSDVCIPKFMNYEEEWDLADLGDESMHEFCVTDNPQGCDMAYVLGLAKTEAEEFMKEQYQRTDLGQANARQHINNNMVYTWWLTKTKPQCIKC